MTAPESATSNCEAGHGLAGALGYLQSPPQGNGSGAGAPLTFPPVLDATCGSRAMWFNKTNPLALYFDRRCESLEIPPGNAYPEGATIEVRPDVQGDFTALPFPNGVFHLVVFDPPHFDKLGANSILAKFYGKLFGDWECELQRGFSECFRVLRDNGVLIFKWCSFQIPLSRVLPLAGMEPLFGHVGGMREKTHWITFLKHTGAVAPADSGDNDQALRPPGGDRGAQENL